MILNHGDKVPNGGSHVASNSTVSQNGSEAPIASPKPFCNVTSYKQQCILKSNCNSHTNFKLIINALNILAAPESKFLLETYK